MINKLTAIAVVLGFLLIFYFTGKAYPEEVKLKVPPPVEIRNFELQPNRLMAVTYANDRVFIYRIVNMAPRSDCNQIKVDDMKNIRLIVQSISNTYEYILDPIPIMVSEWLPYKY